MAIKVLYGVGLNAMKWKEIEDAINAGGGEVSIVTITPTLTSGTKIADFTIDGVAGELYAPAGGGSGAAYTVIDPSQIESIDEITQVIAGGEIPIVNYDNKRFMYVCQDIENDVPEWYEFATETWGYDTMREVTFIRLSNSEDEQGVVSVIQIPYPRPLPYIVRDGGDTLSEYVLFAYDTGRRLEFRETDATQKTVVYNFESASIDRDMNQYLFYFSRITQNAGAYTLVRKCVEYVEDDYVTVTTENIPLTTTP